LNKRLLLSLLTLLITACVVISVTSILLVIYMRLAG
jgi:hypothetical protein